MAEFVSESAAARKTRKPDLEPQPEGATFEGASASATGASRSSGSTASDSLKNWGDFQLLQRLGQGSFGEVYRAWDPVLEREIAVKLLLPSELDVEQQYAIVVSEARAVARVRHTNIVPVYGVERRDGRVGFWSDYVRGCTLRDLVETSGPLPPEEVAGIGATLCAALAAVHAAGLLHRDVKASNAMRDENGRVLLMDFGLSQELRRSSQTAGTPKYMAPELWDGGAASVQSDVYAMGVMLHYLATGRYPAKTPSASGVGLPRGLDQVLRKATDADPQLRHASAAKFGEALTALLPAAKPAAPVRSSRRWWIEGAAVVVVMCIAALLSPQFRTLLQSRAAGTSPTTYKDYLAAEEALLRNDKPGNTELAISLYRKTLDRSPDFALAEAGLAHASWIMYTKTSDQKWLDEANAASAKAFNLNPNLAAVQMTAGSLNVSQGKFDVGLEELQKALALDGRNAAVHGALGDAYEKHGRIDEAKTEFQNAIDLAPDDWRWPNHMGALYLLKGEYKPAEEFLKLALSKSEDNSNVLYNLGYTYYYEKRLPEAAAAFERSAQLAPGTNPLMALGSVLQAQGDNKGAARSYQKAVDLDPTSWRAWAGLADATEWNEGDPNVIASSYQKALDLALKAQKSTPDNADLLAELGLFYAALHEEPKATPLLRKAVLLAPENPEVLFHVGTSYERLGHRQLAIEFIERALKLGVSADYARTSPVLRDLRSDSKAPIQMRKPGPSTTK